MGITTEWRKLQLLKVNPLISKGLLSIFVAEDEGVFFFFALETTLTHFLCVRAVFLALSVFTFKLRQELIVVSPIGCVPTQIVLSLFNAIQHM